MDNSIYVLRISSVATAALSLVVTRILYWGSTVVLLLVVAGAIAGAEPARVIDLWEGLAPGESTRSVGEPLPRREHEDPPATRITKITLPQLEMYSPDAANRTGAAVLIFPGGGYRYVVVDKEGSEGAQWLNGLGITAFVVRYRTKADGGTSPDWLRPLQDGQRAVSLVRHRALELGIDPGRIGVMGFSAGGQTAALVSTRFAERSYPATDAIDAVSCRPDFTLLVYPWQLIDAASGELAEMLTISSKVPSAFLVHTHDDASTSLGSVQYYAALKKVKVSAELHIYPRGGHGYGLRPVEGSHVDTWPDRAADWLREGGLATMAVND